MWKVSRQERCRGRGQAPVVVRKETSLKRNLMTTKSATSQVTMDSSRGEESIRFRWNIRSPAIISTKVIICNYQQLHLEIRD